MITTMQQRHYNLILSGLDIALEVFRELTETEEAAQAALKDFVGGHYLTVWLPANPPVSKGESR